MGQGIDRHLLALRILAMKEHMSPALFAHPVFARFNDFQLSTSQIAYPVVEFVGFGPPTVQSYGVCYMCCLPDRLVVLVGSRRSHPSKNADRMTRAVHQAFRDVRRLVQDSASQKDSRL